MLLYLVPENDPFFNLALEEHLLCATESTWFMLWRNEPTIVVGRHQNTAEEINTSFVEEKGIHVVRRLTGGGAVYHDLRNVNFSFITTVENPEKVSMEPFMTSMVQALRAMGVPAAACGRNDIEVRGRKVSGNAQTLHKHRLLHHGTLLFDSDLSVLAEALRVRPEKFQSKAVKSVRARVGNLRDDLPPEMTVEQFMEQLATAMVAHAAEPALRVEQAVDEAGLHAVRQLRDTRYASWEWNLGRSPVFDLRNSLQTPGGFVECLLTVREGSIEQCAFYGDFMALCPVEPVAEALLGCRFEREAIDNVLAALPLEHFFGTISREEVLQCLFDPHR